MPAESEVARQMRENLQERDKYNHKRNLSNRKKKGRPRWVPSRYPNSVKKKRKGKRLAKAELGGSPRRARENLKKEGDSR